jgi:hypothetical protein
MNQDIPFSFCCIPARAPKAGTCPICQDRYLKNSNVYKFARIDPKVPEIEYAYAHLDCTEKKMRSLAEQGDVLPEEKIRAFWAGVERLAEKAKAAPAGAALDQRNGRRRRHAPSGV